MPRTKKTAPPTQSRDRRCDETTENFGPDVDLTTCSWREGAGRRSSATLSITGDADPQQVAEAHDRFIRLTARGSLQHQVQDDLAAAKAYARSVYRGSGIPNGAPIWWYSTDDERFWRVEELDFNPHEREEWKRIDESELVSLIEKRRNAVDELPFGSREHVAARILGCVDRLETLLEEDTPDRWELVLQSMEFEQCRRIVIDSETSLIDDPQGRTLVDFVDEQLGVDAKLSRPKHSALRQYIPELQYELDRLVAENPSIKRWKAPLVAFLRSTNLKLDERSIKRQLDIEVSYGHLRLPVHLQKPSGGKVTGTLLSLHRPSALPAASTPRMKRRGETCPTKTKRNPPS